jgi:hypothetical protein
MINDEKINRSEGKCSECGSLLCGNCGKCCACGECPCENCHPKEKDNEPPPKVPINYS